MSILEAKKPENVKVNTLMSSKVIKIKGDNLIPHVAQAFRNHHISSAPVVNDESEIIGFVTLGDCLKCMVNCLFHENMKSKTVKDIMTTDVITINDTADIFELESLFVGKSLHDVPVVNQSGDLVGMVSRRDALAGIERLYNETTKYAEELKKPLELTLINRMKYLSKN